MKNYYQILGLSSSATSDEIKSAYRKLAKKFHPDLNNQDNFFENLFKEIHTAYEVLSDKEKKKRYDENLNQRSDQNNHQSRADKEADEFIASELAIISLFTIIISADENTTSAGVVYFKERYFKKFGAGKAFLAVYKLKELIAGSAIIDMDNICTEIVSRYDLNFRKRLIKELLECSKTDMNHLDNKLLIINQIADKLFISENESQEIIHNTIGSLPKTDIEPAIEIIESLPVYSVKKLNKIKVIGIPILLLFIIFLITLWLKHSTKQEELSNRTNSIYAEEFYQSGLSYEEKDQSDSALKYFTKTIEIDSLYKDSSLRLALCYDRQKDYQRAIDILSNIIRQTPNNAEAHYSLAVTLYTMGNESLAIEHYKKAAIYNHSIAKSFCSQNNINWQE